jgi:hypothetical protein
MKRKKYIEKLVNQFVLEILYKKRMKASSGPKAMQGH